MSLCEHCVRGVIHEGSPQGKWEEIGGVRCYVATPTMDYDKDKVLFYLSDLFGPELPNAQVRFPSLKSFLVPHVQAYQLLADSFATNGLKTIAPDYLGGDPVPGNALEPGSHFDVVNDWLPNHTQQTTRPYLDRVITALKEKHGVKRFGATGYCFGARYVFDLAFDNIIYLGVVAHPSLLKVPSDIARYAKESKAPLLIIGCTHDPVFSPEAQEKTDAILGGGKFVPGYKREYFEGRSHGFAVRGNEDDKVAKETAFIATFEWIRKYL